MKTGDRRIKIICNKDKKQNNTEKCAFENLRIKNEVRKI